jgi:hypothetical protein
MKKQGVECSKCWYWDKDKESENMGECRANPPIRLLIQEQMGLWPVTSGEEWCGNFKIDKPTVTVTSTKYKE